MGKPGFPTPPPRRGMGKPGFPMPPPAGGVGGRSPPRNNRMFIGRGAARAAWTAEVTIVRRVQPPSQPPPAGGRSRVPPAGEGQGGGGHRARGAVARAGRPRSQVMVIAAVCGGAAWTAEVTIVRRVQPPSQPPPAGGRSRVPAPGGGGSGKGRNPCLEAGRRRGGETPPLRRWSRLLSPGGSRGAPLLT